MEKWLLNTSFNGQVYIRFLRKIAAFAIYFGKMVTRFLPKQILYMLRKKVLITDCVYFYFLYILPNGNNYFNLKLYPLF